jgi:hypothetical protein
MALDFGFQLPPARKAIFPRDLELNVGEGSARPGATHCGVRLDDSLTAMFTKTLSTACSSRQRPVALKSPAGETNSKNRPTVNVKTTIIDTKSTAANTTNSDSTTRENMDSLPPLLAARINRAAP